MFEVRSAGAFPDGRAQQRCGAEVGQVIRDVGGAAAEAFLKGRELQVEQGAFVQRLRRAPHRVQSDGAGDDDGGIELIGCQD